MVHAIKFAPIYLRETLLQAIAMIINVVGEKVRDTVLDDLRQNLVILLETPQVSILQYMYNLFILQ